MPARCLSGRRGRRAAQLGRVPTPLPSLSLSAGHGHERHLLALYALSASSGAPTPALFLHQAWSEVSASTISTSGARQPSVASFSFGPVCPTGIGVGYLLFASSVECTVSSWKGKGPPAAQVAREIAAAAQAQRCAATRRRASPCASPYPTCFVDARYARRALFASGAVVRAGEQALEGRDVAARALALRSFAVSSDARRKQRWRAERATHFQACVTVNAQRRAEAVFLRL